MIIGVPREIKDNEFRVAIVPAGVRQLSLDGHKVLVQRTAGDGSGILDDEFEQAGAEMLDTAEEIFGRSDMIMKVKEPLAAEYPLIREDQIVFTFFHFASSRELTDAMRAQKAICVAYETISTPDGRLPLLTPMSEVAGRMSIQEGAKYLERPQGGRGVLLSGVPGVEPGYVVVLGGGIVGTNAAHIAAGMGARVVLMDINVDRMRYLSEIMPPNVQTIMSNDYNIHHHIRQADLIVGAVLVVGARAPQLINRSMLSEMKPGAVIVDVAIDQGGSVETSRPTTHADPVFTIDGVVHYCVTNMPGAVSRTSTYALTNVTLPYARKIASKGFPNFAKDDPILAGGVNIVRGEVTCQPVAEAFEHKYFTPITKFF